MSASSSDAATSSAELPDEEQSVVIPTARKSRLQNLSVSVVAAVVLGVSSATQNRRSAFAFERLENATSMAIREISSSRALENALVSQPVEELYDGMTLQLGANIASCLNQFGGDALEDLTRLALRGGAPPEVLSHVMRWIGRLSNPQSPYEYLLTLTRSLEAPSAIVRDGAALGLVELGSGAALPALDAAIGRETNASLRDDLQQVATYLRSKA